MQLIEASHHQTIEEYFLNFDMTGDLGSYSFRCNADGVPFVTESNRENLEACQQGRYPVGPGYIDDCSREVFVPSHYRCECGGDAYGDRSCGVAICTRCGAHEGLERCFCGWSATRGSDGARELVEMGETL